VVRVTTPKVMIGIDAWPRISVETGGPGDPQSDGAKTERDEVPEGVVAVLGGELQEHAGLLGCPDHDRAGAAAGAQPALDPFGGPDQGLWALAGSLADRGVEIFQLLGRRSARRRWCVATTPQRPR
jgi:hypothetical protein